MLEPLPLRKLWMNDLTQAVAFLESLGLAHGDLPLVNILIDRNRMKLSDFDLTAPIVSPSDGYLYPWGRIQGKEAGSSWGKFGDHGPPTEQFALGSAFYYINYDFAPYEDQLLGNDPTGRDHGPEVVDLLQDMVFPELHRDPQLDAIIEKCWHNKYQTVAQLAAETEMLLEGIEVSASMDGDTDRHPLSVEEFQVRKECEEFIERGVGYILAAREPDQLVIPPENRYDWQEVWD